MGIKALMIEPIDGPTHRVMDSTPEGREMLGGPPTATQRPKTFEELHLSWQRWVISEVKSVLRQMTGATLLACRVPDCRTIERAGLYCVARLNTELGRRAHNDNTHRVSAHISPSGSKVLFCAVVPFCAVEERLEFANIWVSADLWAIVGLLGDIETRMRLSEYGHKYVARAKDMP